MYVIVYYLYFSDIIDYFITLNTKQCFCIVIKLNNSDIIGYIITTIQHIYFVYIATYLRVACLHETPYHFTNFF